MRSERNQNRLAAPTAIPQLYHVNAWISCTHAMIHWCQETSVSLLWFRLSTQWIGLQTSDPSRTAGCWDFGFPLLGSLPLGQILLPRFAKLLDLREVNSLPRACRVCQITTHLKAQHALHPVCRRQFRPLGT